MSSLRCIVVQAQLPEFLAQGLDKASRARVREHLRGCGACRNAGSQWLQSRKALRAAAAAADVEAGVTAADWANWQAGILAAVAAEPRSPVQEAGPKLPRIGGPSKAGLLVAAAALLLGALLGSFTDGGLLSRDPIVAAPSSSHPGAFLQPLGQERGFRGAMPARTAGGLEWRRAFASPGPNGRLALRTLEDETLLPSPRAPAAPDKR